MSKKKNPQDETVGRRKRVTDSLRQRVAALERRVRTLEKLLRPKA